MKCLTSTGVHARPTMYQEGVPRGAIIFFLYVKCPLTPVPPPPLQNMFRRLCLYTNVSVTINEHDRIAASRLRLSSHSLAIETGRWSRVPRERRLCSCGEVQTEEHVVCHCPRTIHVRERHPNLNFTDIGRFFDNTDISSVCRVSSLVLKEFMR